MIPFATITEIAESPLNFGVVYVGTDDGNVMAHGRRPADKKLMKIIPQGIYG